MILPDKPKAIIYNSYMERNSTGWIITLEDGNKPKKTYALPKWVSKMIDFKIETSVRDSHNNRTFQIKKALGL